MPVSDGRVASRHMAVARHLSLLFQEARKTAERALAKKLSQEWSTDIVQNFRAEFPAWLLRVEFELNDDPRNHGSDYFEVWMWLSPSGAPRPKEEWEDPDAIDVLESEEGQRIDQWMHQHYGLFPSFLDAALDQARGMRTSFPLRNSSPVKIYW